MRYHNITKDDMLNGEGLRVVLWLAGCVHACEGCHNPETWNPGGGIIFDDQAQDELFSALKPDYIDGITLSGGDPLHPDNIEDVSKLAKDIKKQLPDKTVWLYTGSLYEQVSNLPLMNYVDILVDGKFVKGQLSPNVHWVGSSNQRVIDVAKSKKINQIVLYGG
ncbi:MAG: anaerobic ribonucleoside-triphosphate reductase activating protein [Erysipelotrichaceae bacterium]